MTDGRADWDDRVLAELRAHHEDIIGDVEDEVVLTRYYGFLNHRTQDRTTLRSFLRASTNRPPRPRSGDPRNGAVAGTGCKAGE